MTALKAFQVDRFLNQPLPDHGVFLVYGPDAGLVSERAKLLVERFGGKNSDHMGLINLQMSELEAEPDRLALAANANSLFGGRTIIRLRNASKSLAPSLQQLLDHPPEAAIIIEAGNLLPRDKLRTIAETSKNAYALPCFPDNAQELSKLIAKTFADAGITTESGAALTLSGLLGNDREITRRELEKLVLFADETKHLTVNDIITLCGDNTKIALDQIIDATGCGHAANLEIAIQRAFNSGADPQQVLGSALRHFFWLRKLRAKIDTGASPSGIFKTTFPRPHFSRHSALEQQLRLWDDQALAKAATRIQEAIFHSRQNTRLSQTIARRALLAICLAAARR
ncbi:hypothetical protein MNBD_ALPHA12-781 [hydrothermal vent metagenome]|uniref:DNA-directed DNA polymerase n=1 Tax=hydrothermal vent metagenome TaxID=652676 RepID=A0A3B0U8G9_9ZZZZ